MANADALVINHLAESTFITFVAILSFGGSQTLHFARIPIPTGLQAGVVVGIIRERRQNHLENFLDNRAVRVRLRALIVVYEKQTHPQGVV